jgi:hypothetical protein
MKDRPIALSLALPLMLPLMLLATAVFVPSAPAQRGGFASRGAVGAMVARSGGGARARSMRPRGAGRYLGGWGDAGLFYPDYDAGYDYGPALELPPPQWVPAQPAFRTPAAKPAEALVLEREGDHWVRITPYGPPQTVGQAAAPSNPPERASNAHPETPAAARGQVPAAAKPPAPLPPPPAVLVFRDGHQEQIGQYRIMGATIYVNTDYWSSGAWTRTIPLADLDVPATLKLNQQRGANFRLPSSPDEVMIGG